MFFRHCRSQEQQFTKEDRQTARLIEHFISSLADSEPGIANSDQRSCRTGSIWLAPFETIFLSNDSKHMGSDSSMNSMIGWESFDPWTADQRPIGRQGQSKTFSTGRPWPTHASHLKRHALCLCDPHTPDLIVTASLARSVTHNTWPYRLGLVVMSRFPMTLLLGISRARNHTCACIEYACNLRIGAREMLSPWDGTRSITDALAALAAVRCRSRVRSSQVCFHDL